jgi:hypothetical protein
MEQPKLHNGREVKVFKGYNNSHYTLEYYELLDGEWQLTSIDRFDALEDAYKAIDEYLG